jgi:hypothetical protein
MLTIYNKAILSYYSQQYLQRIRIQKLLLLLFILLLYQSISYSVAEPITQSIMLQVNDYIENSWDTLTPSNSGYC